MKILFIYVIIYLETKKKTKHKAIDYKTYKSNITNSNAKSVFIIYIYLIKKTKRKENKMTKKYSSPYKQYEYEKKVIRRRKVLINIISIFKGGGVK